MNCKWVVNLKKEGQIDDDDWWVNVKKIVATKGETKTKVKGQSLLGGKYITTWNKGLYLTKILKHH